MSLPRITRHLRKHISRPRKTYLRSQWLTLVSPREIQIPWLLWPSSSSARVALGAGTISNERITYTWLLRRRLETAIITSSFFLSNESPPFEATKREFHYLRSVAMNVIAPLCNCVGVKKERICIWMWCMHIHIGAGQKNALTRRSLAMRILPPEGGNLGTASVSCVKMPILPSASENLHSAKLALRS